MILTDELLAELEESIPGAAPADSLKRLVVMLRLAGVTRVFMTFAGSGDEGYVQDPELRPAPVCNKDKSRLSELLCTWGEDLLETMRPGWEIDSGADGLITIDVAAGTARCQYTSYYTSSEDDSFSVGEP